MDLKTRAKQIENQMRDQLRTAVGKPCIICGASGVKGCIWILDPKLSRQHYGSDKSLRVYAYAVCYEHDPSRLVLPESKERFQSQVNEKLIRRVKEKANG